ncbi:hypothetical protein OsJ_10003 [Oryza sativa Japonica Group]|uniref:Uncharacterized protein n=2 Tax=Oryza sativa subsp. japonica TaxID=39947 RepID=A0A8J8YFR7_ORYSJ|nr:hypothetical protein LOC_Os03g12640 [Oryza sativa Japonica Group]EAZ26138.1 hypothetical protein OsJ_10003 [Oryza sativa Japonica Group]
MATAAPAADKRIRQPASNVPIMAQSFAPTRAKLGASNTVSVALCRTMDNDDGLIPSGNQTWCLCLFYKALKLSKNDASNQYCRSSASGKYIKDLRT